MLCVNTFPRVCNYYIILDCAPEAGIYRLKVRSARSPLFKKFAPSPVLCLIEFLCGFNSSARHVSALNVTTNIQQ